MLSSIYYGEIQSDKLVSWNENKDPYNILVENNRVYKLGGWEFLDIANKLFDMVLYLLKRCNGGIILLLIDSNKRGRDILFGNSRR